MKILQCSNSCRASRATRRRQNLLDSARALFVERGFHATGVAQIAAVSGVAVGQIYRDFQAKEDIVAAIVERDVGAFLREEGLAEAIERGDRAAVRTWLGRLIQVDEPIDDCRMMTEIMAERARNARIAEISHGIEARVRANIAAALVVLVPATTAPARLRQLGDLVMALGNGLVCRRIADPELDIAALSATAQRILDDELDRLRRSTVTAEECDGLAAAIARKPD